MALNCCATITPALVDTAKDLTAFGTVASQELVDYDDGLCTERGVDVDGSVDRCPEATDTFSDRHLHGFHVLPENQTPITQLL